MLSRTPTAAPMAARRTTVSVRMATPVTRANPKQDVERVSREEMEREGGAALGARAHFRPAAAAARAFSPRPAHSPSPLAHPPSNPSNPSNPTTNKPPQVQQVLEQTIKEAEETCAGGTTTECASAFDAVEEVSAALAHKQAAAKASDPLEVFCDDNPDADECRIYDD